MAINQNIVTVALIVSVLSLILSVASFVDAYHRYHQRKKNESPVNVAEIIETPIVTP